MDTPRVARLDALTSLRFIAAATIVVHHARGYFGVPELWGAAFPLELGVSFFFVLSGFILTYVYPTLAWKDVPRFWLARFARIWPAHVVAFVLLLVLLPSSDLLPADTVRTAIPNLLLVHAWSPNTEYFFSFNGPSWSVSTELGFYALFPLLIVGLRRAWAVKLVVSILLVVGLVVVANTMLGLPIVKSYKVSAYGLVCTPVRSGGSSSSFWGCAPACSGSGCVPASA